MRAASLVLLLAACGGSQPEPTPPPVEGGWVEGTQGLWTLARPAAADELGAIGYARGWEGAEDTAGVLHLDEERIAPGLNLYSSGHAAEAHLIDARGEVVHTWARPYEDLPGAPPLDGDHQRCWRRVRLLPGGDLLVIHGGRALARLDRDSNVRWVFGERVHHDVVVDDAGDLWTLTRVERLEPRLDAGGPIVDDEVVVLSPDGEVRRRLSVTAAFLGTPWSGLLPRVPGESLHTNSLRILQGRSDVRGLEAGNLLLCARDLDLVFAIDPERERVTWAKRGPWRMPHDPRELADGGLLLFDNLGASAAEHGLASRLVELAPDTGKVRWEWQAEPPSAFFTRFCGTAARLPNGNTLVTETGAGRAFELTPSGEVVWLFQSPHRAGRDGQLVAALFEVERVPEAAAQGW